MASLKHYVVQVAIAFDRLVNAVIRGEAGETLSSVAYRKERDKKPFGVMRPIIDRIFYDGHCYVAYLNDRQPKLPE